MEASYKKIVCIGTKGYPGASRVLRDLEGIGLSKFYYLEDLKSIPKASVAIFAAWHPAYNAVMSRIDAKKFICWTSPALQTELNDPEIDFLSYIIRHEEINGIWFGDPHLATRFPSRGFHLPYPVDVNQIYQYKTDLERSGIGLFSALHNKQKNVLTQFLGIKKLQENNDVKLHTSRLTTTQRNFANLLGLKYEDHGLMGDKEFFTQVQSVKLQSHVFLSESFSYATMESLVLGVPCLMSVKVAKNMGITEKDLIVEDVDDSDEICDKLERILLREDLPVFSEVVRHWGTTRAEEQNTYIRDHFVERINKF